MKGIQQLITIKENKYSHKGRMRMVCEGCKKESNRKEISWFMGHYLCYSCRLRKNMPLVGYVNNEAWKKAESKIMKKKRFIPYLTYVERNYLYKHYTNLGIPYKKIKERYRIINAQLVKAFNRSMIKKQEEMNGTQSGS